MEKPTKQQVIEMALKAADVERYVIIMETEGGFQIFSKNVTLVQEAGLIKLAEVQNAEVMRLQLFAPPPEAKTTPSEPSVGNA